MPDNELQTLIEMKVQEAVGRYDTTILPVLYECDRVNASIANEMTRLHAPEKITERFNNAWDGLKRLIYEIERRATDNGKEKDQLEA